jgi:hypothetical protein
MPYHRLEAHTIEKPGTLDGPGGVKLLFEENLSHRLVVGLSAPPEPTDDTTPKDDDTDERRRMAKPRFLCCLDTPATARTATSDRADDCAGCGWCVEDVHVDPRQRTDRTRGRDDGAALQRFDRESYPSSSLLEMLANPAKSSVRKPDR